MKDIVSLANSWCKSSMTSEEMEQDMMHQLEKYETELENYMNFNSVVDVSSMVSLLLLSAFVKCD